MTPLLEESVWEFQIGEQVSVVSLLVKVVDKTIKRRRFLSDKYIVVFEDLKERKDFRRRVSPSEYLDYKIGERYNLQLPLYAAKDKNGEHIGNVFRRSNLFFG